VAFAKGTQDLGLYLYRYLYCTDMAVVRDFPITRLLTYQPFS